MIKSKSHTKGAGGMMQNDRYTEYMDGRIREIAGKVIYSNEEVMEKWKEVCRQKETSAFPHRRKELQHMLTACGVDWTHAVTEEDWKACIRQVPSSEDRECGIISMLYEIYHSFPTLGDYTERLVRRLGDPAFQGDSVRLAIVKQFIKETDYETDLILQWAKDTYGLQGEIGSAELREAVLRNLQEDVFDLLEKGMPLPSMETEVGKEKYEQKIQDIHKKNRNDYPLLRLADDFSAGRHRKSVEIKEDLYLFAIAFSMTASAGGEGYDPVRDVEKNLFHDYYQDSLLKYISDDYRRHASGIEKEPSGEGINYKNYAEIIYLYVLNRTDLTAREKLALAESLIEECTRKAKRWKKKEKDGILYTEVYRGFFFDDVLELNDKELVKYFRKHFDVPKIHKGEELNAVTEQATAERITKDLLADLKEVYQEKDISFGIKNWTNLNGHSEDFKKDKDFLKILEKMEERLRFKDEWKEWLEKTSTEGSLYQDKSVPTRLGLITLCFYRYYYSGQGVGRSLPEMIEDFCFEVDPLLEQCRYQKISTKNIFDMFALFMLYSISC